MTSLKRSVTVSFVLGVLSVIAIALSHLALTDIWHGEADVSLEWNLLRLAAMVIIAFHVSVFATLWRTWRKTQEA